MRANNRFRVDVSCPQCGKIRQLLYRPERSPVRICRPCGLAGNNRKHGGEGTALYHVWGSMKSRCFCKTHNSYNDYGGRGITVCDEWKSNFAAFRDWAMANGYVPHEVQIDRIDNDGIYEPSNCRFVTCKENQRNRRSTKFNIKKVQAIKVLHDNGWFPMQIANLIKENEAYVCSILRNESWQDAQPDYMRMCSGC